MKACELRLCASLGASVALAAGAWAQAPVPPLVYATIGAPRTWGAMLRYSFD